MQKTKLIDLLSTFSTRERSRFRKYVHSPFFNKHPFVIQLCDYVLEFAPGFDAEGLEKEDIFQVLYGAIPYDENKLNNLISDLLQLLYDFLAYTRFERKEVERKQLLLEELLEREAFKHVEKNANRIKRLLEKSSYKSYSYFERAFHLHEQLDYYELSRVGKQFNENLQLESNHLDLYFLCNKLRLACEMTSRNRIVKGQYDCQLLEELLTYYEAHPELSKHKAILIYYTTLQMLSQTEDIQHFSKLKTLLEQYSEVFPMNELHNLYNYALNYCIQKINSGATEFYREILDIYKVMLDKEIIFVNGYLRQWSFKNIITTSIRLRDFEWTEWFIHHYKSKLLPEEQFNAIAYNLAALYYAKGELRNALLQLQDVEFTSTSYHLGAKIIQLKSYFELKEEEAFYALIEAFKKYLNRNRQISDFQKKANHNFLKIAKPLFQIRFGSDWISQRMLAQKKQQLKERLQTMTPIANLNWLKAQATFLSPEGVPKPYKKGS